MIKRFFFTSVFLYSIMPSVLAQNKPHHKTHKDTVKFVAPTTLKDTEIVPPPMEEVDTVIGSEAAPNNSPPVMDMPEVLAQFPGGQDSMYAFIRHNLQYPNMAKEANIQGKVYVRFEIDTAGNVRNPTILRSANPMLDKAALDCVKQMPQWKPAMNNGKKVVSGYNLPFNFRLE